MKKQLINLPKGNIYLCGIFLFKNFKTLFFSLLYKEMKIFFYNNSLNSDFGMRYVW